MHCEARRMQKSGSAGSPRPAVFFDRDGVINRDVGYLHRPEDFEFTPGAAQAIAACNAAGYLVFIVTNQGGVGLGLYDAQAVETLHAHMRAQLAAHGAHIDDIRYCVHHPNAVTAERRVPCDWRKPGPGMIRDLMQAWPVDPRASFLVGDRETDMAAAREAGIGGHLYVGGDLHQFVRRHLRDSNAARLRHWLAETALVRWRGEGPLFAERLMPDGRADATAPYRVMAQMRQVYVYAHAAVLGLTGDAGPAQRAFDETLKRAALPDGGFAYSLTPQGGILDATRDSYTHAFILLAASWLHRAGGRDMRPVMESVAQAIESLRCADGEGYRESDRPGAVRRQNPHMHLFEAFLAAYEAAGDSRYLARAEEILALFHTRFFDAGQGVLREYFAPDLSALPGPQGDLVEGGHHYEWVWLLGEHARLTGTPLADEARALHRFAAAHTHEAATHLIYRENDADGVVRNGGKRAWALAEAIKAEITLAEHDPAFLPAADRHLRVLFEHFLDRPLEGLWLDTLDPENRPAVDYSAASNFYHVFLGFAEYIRFAGKA